MNKKPLKMRRVFEVNTWEEIDYYKEVKNPFFDKLTQREHAKRGLYYNVPPYTEKPIYRTYKEKTSRLEYLIICEYCSTKAWKRKSTAKYCCNSCRNMSNRKKNKDKPRKQKKEKKIIETKVKPKENPLPNNQQRLNKLKESNKEELGENIYLEGKKYLMELVDGIKKIQPHQRRECLDKVFNFLPDIPDNDKEIIKKEILELASKTDTTN